MPGDLIAEGFSKFVTNFESLGAPVAVGVAVRLGGLNEAVLVHLILALPGGRLTAWSDRVTMAVAYALALCLGLL